jgi:hypothetical protein
MDTPFQKKMLAETSHTVELPYAMQEVVQKISTDIALERAEKIRFLKHQYERGMAPDVREIAAALHDHLHQRKNQI